MKRFHVYILILFLLNSCVIDSFDPLFNISNSSDRELRIYFSNNANMDTTMLEGKSAIISPNEIYFPLKGVSILNKKDYADTTKKLYLFIFDNDIFHKLRGQDNMQKIAERSFLERKIINIIEIKPNDTIFYKNNLIH